MPGSKLTHSSAMTQSAVLQVTGPVTANMREARLRAYDATADSKLVVAIGGLRGRRRAVQGQLRPQVGEVGEALTVNLHIAGCPPSPSALLKGLLTLLQHAGGGSAATRRGSPGYR